MAVDRDGYYIPSTPPWVYCVGHRGVVELMQWVRTVSGWWGWVRWVEPLIIDGVSQGGMHVQVCVPADWLTRHARITDREYARVKRLDARSLDT